MGEVGFEALEKAPGGPDIGFNKPCRTLAGCPAGGLIVQQIPERSLQLGTVVDDEAAPLADKHQRLLGVPVIGAEDHRHTVHSRFQNIVYPLPETSTDKCNMCHGVEDQQYADAVHDEDALAGVFVNHGEAEESCPAGELPFEIFDVLQCRLVRNDNEE